MKITFSNGNEYITINEISYWNFGHKFDTMVYYDNYGEEKSILFNGCLNLDEIIIQLEDLFKSEVEWNEIRRLETNDK